MRKKYISSYCDDLKQVVMLEILYVRYVPDERKELSGRALAIKQK